MQHFLGKHQNLSKADKISMSASCSSSCFLIIILNIIFKHHVDLPLLISKPVSKCFCYISSVKHTLFKKFTFHQFHCIPLWCADVGKEMMEELQSDNSVLNKNKLTVESLHVGFFFSARAGRKGVFLAFSWEVARDLPTMCVRVCFFFNVSFAYFVGFLLP